MYKNIEKSHLYENCNKFKIHLVWKMEKKKCTHKTHRNCSLEIQSYCLVDFYESIPKWNQLVFRLSLITCNENFTGIHWRLKVWREGIRAINYFLLICKIHSRTVLNLFGFEEGNREPVGYFWQKSAWLYGIQ